MLDCQNIYKTGRKCSKKIPCLPSPRWGFDDSASFLHNKQAMKKNRKSERFDDFARINCSDLCIVSGVLTDISREGFKAEFNAPCDVDAEKEYNVQIRLSRINAEPLDLIVRPMWSNFEDGKTSIGFYILHSKDTARLEKYINMLKDDLNSEEDTGRISYDTESLFI